MTEVEALHVNFKCKTFTNITNTKMRCETLDTYFVKFTMF